MGGDGTWSIEAISDRSDGSLKSGHGTDDLGVLPVPADAADCAPLAVPVHLHTTLILTAWSTGHIVHKTHSDMLA